MVIITRLEKRDFDKILENYNIGKYRKHRHLEWALSNTVYEIKTSSGKFILKIFEESNTRTINYHIAINEFLYKKNISVPEVLKTKNKKALLLYSKKKIMVQGLLKGQPKEKIDDELLIDVAKKFGKMSSVLRQLKLKTKYTWGKNHQFRKSKERIGKINDFNFKEEEKELLKELKALNKKKLRRSIIHGDFHGINLLVKENRLTGIIDFDDAHEDYISYEIAVFMIDPFITKSSIKKKQISTFFREYQKELKLREEEKRAVYYFVKHRLLGIIIYCKKQSEIHKDHKERIIKNMINMISRYKKFNEMTVEEFLKLT